MKIRAWRLAALERFSKEGGMEILRFQPWESIPGLCQGVTVRPSRGEPELTYRRLSAGMRGEEFGVIRRLKQIHGARIVIAGKDTTGSIPTGDGLVSSEIGVLGLVTIADCVPVFMLDPVSACWGLLHAGWRGVVAAVIKEGLRVMKETLKLDIQRVEIYLGPSICPCCYEVGPEVARLLSEVSESGVDKRNGNRFYADLRHLLAFQAASCGVPHENIFTSAYCTNCHNELFYSFRAESRRAINRMWAFMGRRV